MIITFIGFMGAGKTYIGNKLSAITNLPFIDLDYYISKQCQLSISDIFSNFGESYFRKKENEALNELALNDNFILSTGGGIVEQPGNQQILKNNKFFNIFLNPDLQIILSRISHKNRPLVKKLSITELENLYYKRQPHYFSISNLTIQGDNSELVLAKILKSISLCKP